MNKECCSRCKGTGKDNGLKCDPCGGAGYFLVREHSIPVNISLENKYGAPDGWNDFTDNGKRMFNYLFEYMDRNQDAIFATDIFKLDDLTNDQIQKVYSIISCARFNISCIAAEFTSVSETNNPQTP